jgi:hypothetical protein
MREAISMQSEVISRWSSRDARREQSVRRT